jgi:hypothetical protein
VTARDAVAQDAHVPLAEVGVPDALLSMYVAGTNGVVDVCIVDLADGRSALVFCDKYDHSNDGIRPRVEIFNTHNDAKEAAITYRERTAWLMLFTEKHWSERE